jgi:hypothetical protein
MIPHLASYIRGELFYSRLARTLAYYPEYTSHQKQSKWLLGSETKRLGILLPAHGSKLLKKIAPVAGLTETDLLDGSLYPAISPFLDAAQRDDLRQDCIANSDPAVSAWLLRKASKPACLRYCPACASEDQIKNIPAHWRTMHQHPKSCACPTHGIHLIDVPEARIGIPANHDPGKMIRPDGCPTTRANPLELIVALELEWLLNVNVLHPGNSRVGAAVGNLLRANSRYLSTDGHTIKRTQIAADLRAVVADQPEALARSDLAGSTGLLWIRHIGHKNNIPLSFSRYALICHLLGTSLAELFKVAMTLPASTE